MWVSSLWGQSQSTHSSSCAVDVPSVAAAMAVRCERSQLGTTPFCLFVNNGRNA